MTTCCTTPTAMLFWAAIFLVFYGAGLLVMRAWPSVSRYADTLILTALAAACFVNFARHRTLHCGLTGPIFALAALVAALDEAGIWRVDMGLLWGAVLLAIGIAFGVEWRTFRQARR